MSLEIRQGNSKGGVVETKAVQITTARLGSDGEMVTGSVEVNRGLSHSNSDIRGDVENGQKSFSESAAIRAYRYPQYSPDKYCISAAVPPPPFHIRRVGRMYVFAEKIGKDGIPNLLCVVGPCWPMVFVTASLIIGVSMAVFVRFLPGKPIWLIVVGALLLSVTVVAFCSTACRDPGIQRICDEPVDSSWTFSEQGQTYRPPGAIYDLEAQVVLRGVDHFCPWTGTVIAGNNIQSFRAFTCSLCALILLVIAVLVISFMKL